MIIEALSRPLPGLSCRKTRKILHISRGSVIALATLGAFGPTTAPGGYSATTAIAKAAVFSHPTGPRRPPVSSQWTDPPDAHPDSSRVDRVVDQLYEKLMRESARALDIHE